MGARTHDPHGQGAYAVRVRSRILPAAGVAEEMAQDRALKRRRRTTLARPLQIDREVERDFAVLNHLHPVGEKSPLQRRRG